MALRLSPSQAPATLSPLEDGGNSWELYLHPVSLADGVPSKVNSELRPQ